MSNFTYDISVYGSTVGEWLALVPHSEKVVGSILGLEVFLCGVCMLSLCLSFGMSRLALVFA